MLSGVGWRSGGLEAVGCWNTEGSTLWIYSASLLLFAAVLALSTLWVFERGPFPKPIQKTVFLLNPCSKRKYGTHSHMHASDWSPLPERKVFSLTAFWIVLKCRCNSWSFTFIVWGRNCTYQLDLWWCSPWRTEACRGSCWKRRWPPGSQSCTACEPAGCARSRGAGSARGGVARCPRCHRSVSTFPARADTSCRWHCRGRRHAHPGLLAHSTPGPATFRWQSRWRFLAKKELLQRGDIPCIPLKSSFAL